MSQKISVIIPTYKPQSYLWSCLDSLCNQTLSEDSFEVIIVLNGCKDHFDSDIKKYLEMHKAVNWRYFQIDQAGVSNARNFALDKANGEYITFLDDDDYVNASYLQELYDKASYNCTPICNTIAFVDLTNEIKKDYVIANTFKRCSKKSKITIVDARRYFAGPVRKLIHKGIIGTRRFNVEFKNGEDSLFMFLISDKIKSISCTSDNAIYYRRLRTAGANSHHRSFIDRFCNSIMLIVEYTSIYISAPTKYNLRLYIMFVLGAIKTIFVG